ncbi:MAG: hypothetical protein WBM17_04470, partial [Anaerolineales bacterium]
VGQPFFRTIQPVLDPLHARAKIAIERFVIFGIQFDLDGAVKVSFILRTANYREPAVRRSLIYVDYGFLHLRNVSGKVGRPVSDQVRPRFFHGERTKNGKSATTYLLEIPELLDVVAKWDEFIRGRMPPTAMWYTPIINRWGEQTPSPDPPGVHRHTAIAKRMRILFPLAGIPYKSPHKFRHGHAVYALQHAKTMADYKAISQNLMHNDIRLTDSIYAPLLGDEIRSRIRSLTGDSPSSEKVDGDLAALLGKLSKKDRRQALVMLANLMAE